MALRLVPTTAVWYARRARLRDGLRVVRARLDAGLDLPLDPLTLQALVALCEEFLLWAEYGWLLRQLHDPVPLLPIDADAEAHAPVQS